DQLWSTSLVAAIAARARRAACLVAFNQRDRKFALWAGLRTAAPVVVHVGNQHRFHGPRLWRWFKEKIYGFYIRRASLLVCTSPTVEAEMLERFGTDPARTVTLPNGIEVDRFEKMAKLERASLGVSEQAILALNLGRLAPQKGQDLLLEALARVEEPRLHLLLVGQPAHGSPGYGSGLRELAARLGIGQRVHFLGWRDDVAELLGTADFFVASSRWEGSPLAVLEAMAAGLPVLYTDCSGRLGGFEDGVHGQTVATGQVEPLARGLSALARLTPEQRRQSGLAARQLVRQNYDVVSITGPRFVALIEALLKRSSPAESATARD
ncbi:MAG: glycosyltransferase family 4 protein, partial [Candidatus Eremiobacteraeota bacterium]|nr:glycosyltransferase family 4 protein [Candidatus Eremiobacteraeota bacterium]